MFLTFLALTIFLMVQTLFQATDALQRWAIVNFSARCDVNTLIRDMIKCGERKGMVS